MNLPSIGTDLLELVMRRTTHSAVESREDVLRGICAGLFQSGAQHVRYYDIGTETIPDLPREKTLYLTWQEAAPGQPTGRQGLGYRIPFQSASISRQAVQVSDGEAPLLLPVQGMPEDHPRTWVDDFDLQQRTWIDVAIYDHQRLVGVLAFYWKGPPIEWTSTTTTILLLLGQLAGAQIEAAAPRVETDLRRRVRELYREGSKQQPIEGRLLQKAVHFFQEVVRVSSVSIFRYDWERQVLVREAISTLKGPIESPSANTLADVALRFEGETFEVGSKLTGLAWKSPDYRRVLDFKTLEDLRPDLISPAVMDFHTKYIGSVESVMYGIVGDRDKRYLLRVINNYDDPKLPFLAQFDLLNRFLGDLAPLPRRQ